MKFESSIEAKEELERHLKLGSFEKIVRDYGPGSPSMGYRSGGYQLDICFRPRHPNMKVAMKEGAGMLKDQRITEIQIRCPLCQSPEIFVDFQVFGDG